eukprot:1907432-Rhodomonas_salina.3
MRPHLSATLRRVCGSAGTEHKRGNSSFPRKSNVRNELKRNFFWRVTVDHDAPSRRERCRPITTVTLTVTATVRQSTPLAAGEFPGLQGRTLAMALSDSESESHLLRPGPGRLGNLNLNLNLKAFKSNR